MKALLRHRIFGTSFALTQVHDRWEVTGQRVGHSWSVPLVSGKMGHLSDGVRVFHEILRRAYWKGGLDGWRL